MELAASDVLRDILGGTAPLYWLVGDEALYQLPNGKMIRVCWDMSVSPAVIESIFDVPKFDPIYIL